MDKIEYYTVLQAADILGIKENHLRQLIWRGKLQKYKRAGEVFVLKSEVELRLKIVKVV